MDMTMEKTHFMRTEGHRRRQHDSIDCEGADVETQKT